MPESMPIEELKKTPLYETHIKNGARMMPFAGWLLPEWFPEGSIREHLAVRRTCGLFDTCHMPEFICRGPQALETINYLFTNDYSDLRIGSARYGMMCDEQGGILDDLIVHRLAEDVYLVPMNAANRERDFQWILEHSPGAGRDGVNASAGRPGSGAAGAEWLDISDQTGSLALQGPLAERVLSRAAEPAEIPQGRFRFTWPASIRGIPALIARTGYSGEDGFEIYTEIGRIAELWELLAEAGRQDGLQLCGLGSRDTLRIEAGMPLYGPDLSREVTPVEAGLAYGLRLDRGDFIGREAILHRTPPAVRRIGIRVTGSGIIRGGQDIYITEDAADEPGSRTKKKIGTVTSGTYCAFADAALGMGYVEAEVAQAGQRVIVEVRHRYVEAKLTELPFYIPPYKR